MDVETCARSEEACNAFATLKISQGKHVSHGVVNVSETPQVSDQPGQPPSFSACLCSFIALSWLTSPASVLFYKFCEPATKQF